MGRVLVAARAMLLPLHALRMLAPVLRREVVPFLAHRAGEDHFISRHGLSPSSPGKRINGSTNVHVHVHVYVYVNCIGRRTARCTRLVVFSYSCTCTYTCTFVQFVHP